MLKAACTHNPCYIDRLITVTLWGQTARFYFSLIQFFKLRFSCEFSKGCKFKSFNQVFENSRLNPLFSRCREHLNPTTPENSAATSELLMLSLELVKHRVGVMGLEIRKNFIGSWGYFTLGKRPPDHKYFFRFLTCQSDWKVSWCKSS